ncbi:RHS repeat-associated core domain-containing protein [Pseudochryseolinea flava]|uniref:RHS repeat-associated core domain-containing protein n=1 Tax=Pseudochryseolinea flava TaxID=2059302 RepID=UPI0014030D6F|nr:RHS repeat-associated core domain-containing protein [Pseudochryseolinea flava]
MLVWHEGDDQPAAYLNYFLFLSYDNAQSTNYVYFDYLNITLTKSNVIQYNDYYPFGLEAATSWTRENNTNSFLYNAGNELNKTSGWYEMFYRGYDPALGRMLQVDPYATSFASSTPYNYALNSPVMGNDPSGGYAYMSNNFGREMMDARSSMLEGNGWAISMTPSEYGRGAGMYRAFATAGSRGVSLADFFGETLAGNNAGGTWTNGRAQYFADDGAAAMWVLEFFDNLIGTEPGALDKLIANAGFAGATVLRAVTVEVKGKGNFGGEPYRADPWLHYRLNEATLDYASLRRERGHEALDLLGIIPGFGEAFDFINGVWYSFEGRKLDAGLSYAAVVPVIGNVATGAKVGIKAAKRGAGVYDLGTTLGKYVGQSKDIMARVTSHFANGGKLSAGELQNAVFHSMPGSTKLQREVYEQFLINKWGIDNLLNVRNPMGGRMDQYNNMIDDVIKQFGLPR